nr:hypothetical protein GCM10020092_069810 [Actinoplanes digitatis]
MADLAGAVAGQRTEEPAARQEPVARLDDAELVALGVGEHDVLLVRQLPDVVVLPAELQRPGHGPPLSLRGLTRQFEVRPVPAGLSVPGWHEPDSEPGAVAGRQRDVVRVVGHLPAQDADQKRARRSGSTASTLSADSREVIAGTSCRRRLGRR